MDPYYFLFGVALLWTIFAVVQDLRTREIANWLTFSLIALVLAYRFFYSSESGNWMFFLFGVLGVLFFVGAAFALYYGRAFAGGDAKLLMGFGGVIPIEQYSDLLFHGVGFVLALFLIGAAWTIVFSFYVVMSSPRGFARAFAHEAKKFKRWFVITFVLGAVLIGLLWSFNHIYALFAGISCIALPLTYAYARSLEKGCLIVLTSPQKLTEGDWLERPVRVGTRTIRPSVHGLNKEEIAFLRKHHKSVYIKNGIPFAPAFLLALIAMVFFFSAQSSLEMVLRNFF